VTKDLQSVIAELPDEWPFDPIPEIRRLIEEERSSLVVLDDDPTGTQTVYDIPVLTRWSADRIRNEFERNTPLFYILTNSRRLHERDAVLLADEIGRNLKQAAADSGRTFRVLSRSDSTLRGHFPAEVDALASALNQASSLRIIMPFFYEGGRFTIDDIHYVKDGTVLIPAGETQFAQDATFGYRSSNLRDWIVEKTQGKMNFNDITGISLEEIRCGGPLAATKTFIDTKAKVCVVNAVSRRDAEVVALALMRAGQSGLQFICRSAASLVAPLGGLYPRPLLRKKDLDIPSAGGSLTIVGSYVPASSRQLAHLIDHAEVTSLELDVKKILSGQGVVNQIRELVEAVDKGLSEDKDLVLYTSRELVRGVDANSSLEIVQRVSACLVEIISGISQRPRFIMAKGGITSSDIATHGLAAEKTTVLGQILPGVPVWQMGAESKFGKIVYIVFPGNVGETDAMTRIVRTMKDSSNPGR
jgi:uncharacterized protein YgbK (DUF1537 family)